MLKKCWKEYIKWLKTEWKHAWGTLVDSITTFIDAIFVWIYTILGSVIAGFWKLFLKPILAWIQELIKNWIKKI